jgi:endonuclease YncB( thermonuclease family)
MRLRSPRYEVSDTVCRQLNRRRRIRRVIFCLIALLSLSVVLGRLGPLRYRGDDWRDFDQQRVTVTHVVDGDTVRVRLSSAAPEETVRLLGIDAPEISHASGEGSHWGLQAAEYLKGIAEGRSVTLRLDSTQTRDKYRRLLAYLYLGDTENVNQSLVRDGHAYAFRTFPHSQQRQFEQAETEARGKRRGLWADLTDEQMPPWRQAWLSTVKRDS